MTMDKAGILWKLDNPVLISMWDNTSLSQVTDSCEIWRDDLLHNERTKTGCVVLNGTETRLKTTLTIITCLSVTCWHGLCTKPSRLTVMSLVSQAFDNELKYRTNGNFDLMTVLDEEIMRYYNSTWTSVSHFTAMHWIVNEIFQSRTKWSKTTPLVSFFISNNVHFWSHQSDSGR